jgi:hypothetical protein
MTRLTSRLSPQTTDVLPGTDPIDASHLPSSASIPRGRWGNVQRRLGLSCLHPPTIPYRGPPFFQAWLISTAQHCVRRDPDPRPSTARCALVTPRRSTEPGYCPARCASRRSVSRDPGSPACGARAAPPRQSSASVAHRQRRRSALASSVSGTLDPGNCLLPFVPNPGIVVPSVPSTSWHTLGVLLAPRPHKRPCSAQKDQR